MTLVVSVFGGVAGILAALVAGFTLGAGPIAVLIILWLGGLAATFALAIDFAGKTAVGEFMDELPRPGSDKP